MSVEVSKLIVSGLLLYQGGEDNDAKRHEKWTVPAPYGSERLNHSDRAQEYENQDQK
jgi:hypothetical protein